tara:strand:+ start:3010 stop:3657 length:648 start_codon:yes stop_codon:yes gene_type:complete
MSVSILIPTFNRKKFSNIISLNIISQTYPLIKEIIIADDGDEKERLNITCKYSILYYVVPRMSIGEKRNLLKNKASSEYIVHMDTDDFYNPDYISNSIYNLISNNKALSGSSNMIMYANNKTYKQQCIYLNLLNEATLCYTKEYSNFNNFASQNSSEGIIFCKCEHIVETEIEDIMICLCHSENTVNKNAWLVPDYEKPINMNIYKNHLNLLSNL